MDLHKLRIFVAIARTGSFTRAAEQLYTTQPTVSQQLAQLEAELGVALIERRPRHQRLTAAGETLLPRAEELLSLAASATEETRTAAGLAERTMRLGVGFVLAAYLLPGVLRRYRDTHPDLQVHITVGNTAELLDGVAAGTIDLALVGSPVDHPDIDSQQFRVDRLVVIVARDDEWAMRHSVAVGELATRTLLTREPGSALHASVGRLLGLPVGTRPNTIVLGETEAIKRCVEAGVGVAIVQRIAIEREVMQGTLCALELDGGDNQRRYLYAWRRYTRPNRASQALIDLLGVV